MKRWLGLKFKFLILYFILMIAGLWIARFLAQKQGLLVRWDLLFFILFVSGVIFYWGLNQFLLRPLREITEAVEKFREGFFNFRIHLHPPKDEWGKLGNQLNRLGENIQGKIGQISKELAESQAVLAGMEEEVLILDLKGRIQKMNEAMKASALHLYPSDVGKHYLEVFREPDLNDLIQSTLQSKENQRRNIFLFGYPGKTFQVQTSLIHYPENGGKGVVLVFHDVTDWKQLERVRQEFVANVSHELRTPLTAVKGYVEALGDEGIEEGSQAHKFLQIIERHTERMDKIVSDLLLLSELDLKDRALQKEDVSIPALIQAAIESLRPTGEEKGQQLSAEVSGPLPSLQGDGPKLQQMIINLLQNAIAYTPEKGQITVGAKEVAGGVEVFVTDNGIGIPPEDLPRIFERFYRVDKGRSRELGGTGLGLAIVKQIVEAHGGSVRLESKLGQGSRFTVFLPVNL